MGKAKPDPRFVRFGNAVLQAAASRPVEETGIGWHGLNPSGVGANFARSFSGVTADELLVMGTAELRSGAPQSVGERLQLTETLDWLDRLSPDELASCIQVYVGSPDGLRKHARAAEFVEALLDDMDGGLR